MGMTARPQDETEWPKVPLRVLGCARCGADHDGLMFRMMEQPIGDDTGPWTHWATCPRTGDPILMRMANPKPAVALSVDLS